ncbi:uncharacterized protein LOC111713312 isoform X3 [Eurytemora carolleeae]|uniref:uncharacterized protein LOC111713312 isoform X3 n=1 Tax=Eurytemora carolleeae TaxID=1294199 RepID=UPI000C77C028|nr:uncharacterized protein LOC111713312 isoform X3 [Eurytemora carolleeae]|eukprot:XP_023343934.1 uncharacterized protein LOC111713312 isoform X3 [Eurytemora affinis]
MKYKKSIEKQWQFDPTLIPEFKMDENEITGGGGNNQALNKRRDEAARRRGLENYEGNSGANVILYIGLGMVAMGLVITFVGLGDKGFRTLELKLIGPSLVGCGMFFALLRILFCTIPSCCSPMMGCCRRTEENQKLLEKEPVEREKSEIKEVTIKQVGFHEPVPLETPKREVRPHFVSDSDDDFVEKKNSIHPAPSTIIHTDPLLGQAKQPDSLSSSSSSAFSLNEADTIDLEGSTRNIRTGEIILNATKLNIEAV